MKQRVHKRRRSNAQLSLNNHAVVVASIVTDPYTTISKGVDKNLANPTLLLWRVNAGDPICRQDPNPNRSAHLRRRPTRSLAFIIKIRNGDSDRSKIALQRFDAVCLNIVSPEWSRLSQELLQLFGSRIHHRLRLNPPKRIVKPTRRLGYVRLNDGPPIRGSRHVMGRKRCQHLLVGWLKTPQPIVVDVHGSTANAVDAA